MCTLFVCFFSIAVSTGGIGVHAVVQELFLISGFQLPLLLTIPVVLRWSAITASFFDTPFSQNLSKYTWTKNKIVRIMIPLIIAFVITANLTLAIVSAIPGDDHTDWEPPFRTYPYYEWVKGQAALWAAIAFILVFLVGYLGKNVFTVLKLSSDTLKKVKANTSDSSAREKFLRLFKLQTLMISAVALAGYPVGIIVDLANLIAMEQIEDSRFWCFFSWGCLL